MPYAIIVLFDDQGLYLYSLRFTLNTRQEGDKNVTINTPVRAEFIMTGALIEKVCVCLYALFADECVIYVYMPFSWDKVCVSSYSAGRVNCVLEYYVSIVLGNFILFIIVKRDRLISIFYESAARVSCVCERVTIRFISIVI